MQRKLAVILSADVAGYSALMERDEAGTLAALIEHRRTIVEPAVADAGGRIFKLMGDGLLAEFPSAGAAAGCALAVQGSPAAAGLQYRIGINLGDVIADGDDIYGDGVNVAARLQALAAQGGIAVSRTVAEQIAGKVAAALDDLGEHRVKNIARPVHVFALRPAESPERMSGPPPPGICVLPFANISGDLEQDYFADGISEDIITDLSKVSALHVIARNTAFQFKGKAVDVPQVARQLKVTHVLEGSVRKAGNRVRITAQLIDGASGGHVWAERYDRDLKDIFDLQDDITTAIVGALKVHLLPEERKAIARRGTQNVEAYDLYLMARQLLLSGRAAERLTRAVVRMGLRATELDAGFAEAWALIATVQERMRFSNGLLSEDGTEAARRALALNPDLAEARAIYGSILARKGDLAAADAETARALSLDPENAQAHSARAAFYFRQGRSRDAVPHYEKAAALNLDGFSATGMLITCHLALGDKAAAEHAARATVARCEAALQRGPDNCDAMAWIVPALGALGQMDRARQWMARALLFDPDNNSLRYNFACTLAVAGDTEAALDTLDTVLASETMLDWIKADPDLANLRPLPRFQALVARLEREHARPRDG